MIVKDVVAGVMKELGKEGYGDTREYGNYGQ